MQQGYVIIEAEDLPLSSQWQMRTDAPGTNNGCGESSNESYTGSGYMRYIGPHLMCASMNLPEGATLSGNRFKFETDHETVKKPGDWLNKALNYLHLDFVYLFTIHSHKIQSFKYQITQSINVIPCLPGHANVGLNNSFCSGLVLLSSNNIRPIFK